MVKITNEQVEFILTDFEKHGIVLEDLRDSLLDHMCCIIENEMQESDNFYQFYERVLPRFFKDNLVEIQVETDNLLKFKNFYSMKKTLNISGALTVLFTLTGAILKTFHLPGAGITIVLGGFLFSLVFLPLLIALKFRDEESKTDKFVFAFGFLVAMAICTGLIFKLMHWPYANMLMLGGTVTFTFIYVPIYFLTRFRRPEVKFNTIVNSVLMMACGGILFSLFNLKSSAKYDELVGDTHYYLHDNSVQLFESNDRLMVDLNDDVSKNMHAETAAVNAEIEAVVKLVVDESSAGNIEKALNKLSTSMKAYNASVSKLDGIKNLDLELVNAYRHLDTKKGLEVLSRIQQQIAVNENCYLTSL